MGKLKDKVWDAKEQMAGVSRADFIQFVMKEEDVDYETAYYICIGRTDPREPEYTLGYKMADPSMMMAMFGQMRKKKREAAREEFRSMLEADELQLFEEYVNKEDTEKQFKSAYKKEKRTHGPDEEYVRGYTRRKRKE